MYDENNYGGMEIDVVKRKVKCLILKNKVLGMKFNTLVQNLRIYT